MTIPSKAQVEFVLLIRWKKTRSQRGLGTLLPEWAGPLLLLFFTAILAAAQSPDAEKPIPILTGTAGTFSFVTAGQQQLDAQINPVLLLPLGDHWLLEGRAEFQGPFQRPSEGGPYGGPVSKNLDYLQADYIANKYVTVTIGRFLTPFGIFNERLYPIWIRSLQQ